MPKNNDFLQALNDPAGLQQAANVSGADLTAVLDTILAADINNAVAFNRAFYAQQAFWNAYSNRLLEIPLAGTLGFRAPDATYPDSTRFLDPDDQRTFGEIKQAAAEARIKLGLRSADKDTLIDILSNNRESCRDYLALKPDFGNLPKAFDNDDVATNLLTNDAIDDIRASAIEYLWPKLLAEVNDPNLLDALLVNGLDDDAKKAAAVAIGFPATMDFADFEVKTGPVQTRKNEFLQQAALQTAQNAREQAKADFQAYVAGHYDDDGLVTDLATLAAHKNALEGQDGRFKETLPATLNTRLNDGDITWAKGVLGARYLVAALANPGAEFAVTADLINADADNMKNGLKALRLIGNHPYVDDAVTEEVLPALKQRLTERFLRDLPTTITVLPDPVKDTLPILNELQKIKDLAAFKLSIQKLGITDVNWIQEKDMILLKHSIRQNMFAQHIANVSRGESRPELLAALGELPPGQQIKLLETTANADPTKIRHLLHAQDEAAAKYYLGDSPEASDVVADVVAENRHFAQFSRIHNAAVAKVLAGIDPRLTLDEGKIQAVNAALKNNQDLGTDPQYDTFLNAVNAAVGVDVADAFRTPAIKAGIYAQITHNAVINNMLDPYPGSAKILGALANLEKSAVLDEAQIKLIGKTLLNSKTLTEFLSKVNSDASIDANVKAQLKNELTTARFNELKAEMTVARLQGNNLAGRVAEAKEINQIIDGIKEEQDKFHANSDNMSFIASVNPTDLFNPAFQGQAKANASAMQAKYQAMSDECDLVVNQLNHDYNQLQSHMDQIPKGVALNDETKELQTRLEKELQNTANALEFYRKAQNNLSGKEGILAAIDTAVSGKKNYVYQSEGVTCTPVEREKVREGLSNDAVDNPPVPLTAQLGGPSTIPQRNILVDAAGEGKVHQYDVVYNSPDRTFQATGRFTQDYNMPAPEKLASVRNEQGQISRPAVCKLELIKAPTQTLPQPTGRPHPQQEAANVKFYLDMANAIIAANGGKAPNKEHPIRLNGSNDNEMKWLWGALITLGKGTPKFGPEAISIESGSFVPEIGFFGNIKEPILEVFNKPEHKALLTSHSKDAADLAKTAATTTDNQAKAAAFVEKYNKGVKEHPKTKQTIEEGPAPEADISSRKSFPSP